MNINFAFLRHGYGCHNAMSSLVKGSVVDYKDAKLFMRDNDGINILRDRIVPLNDPVLTNIGVEASIHNGCIINKILKRLPIITNNDNLDMSTFNVVGCSPLIRCMETAYYMTRKWKNPPAKIYVFPLLREIDESSVDKYSKQSLETIRIKPSYAIKTIEEQEDYLKSIGIYDFFDFSFVKGFPKERIEPGDVHRFTEWFGKYFVNLLQGNTQNLNVFVTTHAGVLRDFVRTLGVDEGFYNNSGFVINTTYDNKDMKLNHYVSLNNYIDTYDFFKDYNNQRYNNVDYYCPSDRCGQLCSVAKGKISDKVKTIGLKCDSEETVKRTVAIRRKFKTPDLANRLDTVWNE
jgi:broad specificity phosphatase PhoE